MVKRRWIVILDGSANRGAATKDIITSNAFRMIRPIEFVGDGIPQIVFYFSGVGTRGDGLSAVTGRGFDDIIIEAYVALSSNFQDGDSIYVFGFSRGAAAARALTGMLSDPGLLRADRLEVFPQVWEYFLFKGGEGQRRVLKNRIGQDLYKPFVEFLGVFDAVAGQYWDVGKLFNQVRFDNLKVAPCVRNAVHILSIDDDRRVFAPLLWDGPSKPDQVLEQIWIPGVHADIGGSSDGTLLGDISLLTMLNRLRKHCPELVLFEKKHIDKEIKPRIETADSLIITSERGDFLRALLRRRMRIMGALNESAGEYIHPILEKIIGKEIILRGRRAVYQPSNYGGSMRPIDLEQDGVLMINKISRLLA